MVAKRALSLDGGGVRGISSLLILRELLRLVSGELKDGPDPMLPLDVFNIIVGTSTGGLIALMLVKLKMPVDECIKAYRTLSERIFGNPYPIGRLTRGIVKDRYSATNMQNVIHDFMKEQGKDSRKYMMEDDECHPGSSCSVVCRELANDSTEMRQPDPVFLCSHQCRRKIGPTTPYNNCLMSDAAKATTAAPTYFPPHTTLGKILIDGGFGETNNPSEFAYFHYEQYHEKRIKEEAEELKLSVWVNIGTGSPTKNDKYAPPSWRQHLVPKFIKRFSNHIRNLKIIATAADVVGQRMKMFARPRGFLFARFSADQSVHMIGLDRHTEIEKIESLTWIYLRKPETQTQMRMVAVALAADIAIEREAIRRRVDQDYLMPRRSTTLGNGGSSSGPLREMSPIRRSHSTSSARVLNRPSAPSLLAPDSRCPQSRTSSGSTAPRGQAPGSHAPSAHEPSLPGLAGQSEQTAEASDAEHSPVLAGKDNQDPLPALEPNVADTSALGDQFPPPKDFGERY